MNRITGAAFLGALGVIAGASRGQVSADLSGRYLLHGGSQIQEGCFPPCLCPLITADVQGSLCVQLITVGDVHDFYRIVDVRLTIPGVQRSYTGTGMMRYSSIIQQQQISLDLFDQNGGAAQHFDSEQVAVTVPPPELLFTVSLHQMVCFDTAITVSSARTRADWNSDGHITSGDVTAYLNTWFADLRDGTHQAEFDGDGASTSGDVTAFLTEWFVGAGRNC